MSWDGTLTDLSLGKSGDALIKTPTAQHITRHQDILHARINGIHKGSWMAVKGSLFVGIELMASGYGERGLCLLSPSPFSWIPVDSQASQYYYQPDSLALLAIPGLFLPYKGFDGPSGPILHPGMMLVVGSYPPSSPCSLCLFLHVLRLCCSCPPQLETGRTAHLPHSTLLAWRLQRKVQPTQPLSQESHAGGLRGRAVTPWGLTGGHCH